MSWDERYLNQAEFIANNYSKDPSTKIGAVIVSESNSILTQGFNGFPRGIVDTDERLNDRETKYKLVVHGEMNAILNASRNGIALLNSTLYIYGLPPCSSCAGAIIQTGIRRVVVRIDADKDMTRWKESCELSLSILAEAGVEYNNEWIL